MYKKRDVRDCPHSPLNSELHHRLTKAPTVLYGKQSQQKTPAEMFRPLLSA